MDRAVYRLVTLAVIALAVAYFWVNYNSIRTEVQAFTANWWHE